MTFRNNAFTLVELLVAMALFVSLMALVSTSFQRLSSGGERALQVLELHRKADAVMRFLEDDVRNLQQMCAVHAQVKTEPYTLTFMRPAGDSFDNFFHRGQTVSSKSAFSEQPPRLTDMMWVRWSWTNGAFSRGQSRNNSNAGNDSEQWESSTYLPNTKHYIKDVEVDLTIPKGIQNNAITPTPQRHYDYFEGMGASIYPIDSNGNCAAGPGQKVAVYETVQCAYQNSGSYQIAEFFDYVDSPWRLGDYRHLYTTIDCGNQTQISDAYAVRNPNGLTVNKDKLNLLGNEATDADGDKIYPSQMRFLFDGVEYLTLELFKRDGSSYTSVTDESDRLGDGTSSIDISGVDPLTGEGADKRPVSLRISFLLHKIELDIRDDDDFDFDNDTEEPLSAAIRQRVSKEKSGRIERMELYKFYANQYGQSAIIVTQIVRIGL